VLELELRNLVEEVQKRHAESQTIELKAAHEGCPTRLYDTLSSFSNQDDGGILLFGIDESRSFEVVGVYDVQDLMKHVGEQCSQMHPKVRAVFTDCSIAGKHVVSAEIPAQDVADRPCFYEGRGRYKGSYVRVGDADEPMTEYEIYSYEAFRRKYEDELRVVERAEIEDLDRDSLLRYELALKEGRPHLAGLSEAKILDLMSVVREGKPTLAGVILFSLYPQAFFPQLGIISTRIPGVRAGDVGTHAERFIDNTRLEGTLGDQVSEAVAFVRKNIRVATKISESTGERTDMPQYPIEAVRELILNALIHRDYSIHTQGMPIQLQIFDDRLTVTNPGGLYGRLSVDQLGKLQPDTRNPVIANAMEILGLTENRYSGIPTVRRLAAEYGLPEPIFENARGEFRATLRLKTGEKTTAVDPSDMTITMKRKRVPKNERRIALLEFCRISRTRQEIVDFLGLSNSPTYAMRAYVRPLIADGRLRLAIPDKPQSKNQTYQTV
jgi:ATP-dependent DNA helicase RecG